MLLLFCIMTLKRKMGEKDAEREIKKEQDAIINY